MNFELLYMKAIGRHINILFADGGGSVDSN